MVCGVQPVIELATPFKNKQFFYRGHMQLFVTGHTANKLVAQKRENNSTVKCIATVYIPQSWKDIPIVPVIEKLPK